VALKDTDLLAALRLLGLREESLSQEPVYDTGHFAVSLPGGWLGVIGDGFEAMDTVQPSHARQLSVAGEALHFYCDDAAMCATLAAYRDGEEVWALRHDGSEGRGRPEISGAPPAIVGEIVRRLEAEQSAEASADVDESGDVGEGDDDDESGEVDYLYDAPAEVALALIGFRHDQTLAAGAVLPISILAPVSS
jgi:hypothetical protein